VTTPPAERWILCGGVTHPDAPEDALHLAVGGPEKNLTVDIAGVSDSLTGRVPPSFKDLLRIAAYVLAADSAVQRGDRQDADLNAKWHRRFRFIIGVECPDLWSTVQMREVIEQTLGFLTDDAYSFEFRPATTSVPEQLSFSGHDGSPFLPWDDVDEVVLFSGGLDSLAGTAEQVLGAKKRVILVSHRSASKTWKTQRQLVDDLRKLSNGRGPDHVAIEVVKHEDALRVERTQRSRSLLYAAIAGAVAHLVGRDRILLYENGIVGLNLPVSRQVVGATATRTAHPKVLAGFSRILSAVEGRKLVIENPFALQTRADTLKRMAACGAARLIRYSVSCAHVHQSSTMHPHCGVCSQCIDRRFGVLAAGLEAHDPEEGYAVDLVTGERTAEVDRALLLDYVASADRFTHCKTPDDFLAEFGEANRAIPSMMDQLGMDADTAARAVFDLHRRHGDGVGTVLKHLFAQYAKEIRNGALPATSLIMLLSSAGLRAAQGAPLAAGPSANPVLSAGGEYQFRRDAQMWILRFRGGRPFPMEPHKGLTHIRFLLQQPGERMTAFALVDLSEGREVASRPLSTALGPDAKTIHSVRSALDELKKERDEAQEYSDQKTVDECSAKIEKLEEYIRNATGLGGKVRREAPDQKRARMAVSNAIERAIEKIRKQSQPLATYLDSQIRRGFFLEYRDTGIPWET
jgi:7-cyano-7-deazaguanine synthase in queuosine biosynthesis